MQTTAKHVMSPTAKASIAGNPQVLLHPSVLICDASRPYDRNKHYEGTKTMVFHQNTTLVSGTTYKCNSCGETFAE